MSEPVVRSLAGMALLLVAVVLVVLDRMYERGGTPRPAVEGRAAAG